MQEGKGDNGIFITLVTKVLINVFLFAGLTALGTYAEFY